MSAYFGSITRTLKWFFLPAVVVAAFACGYSYVPQLRNAVDSLTARVAALRALLGTARAERDAALSNASLAESEKQRANSLAARYRKELEAAQAELSRVLAEVSRLTDLLAAANAEAARLAAELAAKPTPTPVDLRNGQCPACRAAFYVSQRLIDHKEDTRCPNCRIIKSARSFVNYRSVVLSRQR